MRFDESALQHNDILLFHSTVPAGKRPFQEHHHTQFEISYFLSGKGIYQVKTKEYLFQSGDVFLFSSNEIHCITEIFPDENLELVNLHFEPRLLWSSDGFSDAKLLRIFLNRNERFENQIDRANAATPKIKKDMMRLEQELKEKKHGYELMSRFYLARILIRLVREYDYVTEPDQAPQGQTHLQLEKAMKYIDANLDKELTLEQLAEQAAMSKTYFSTLFKTLNGISPWDYITIKRIERAISLLQTTSLSKLEIAGICGFSSSSNFYKAFKRVTGKTPGAFNRTGSPYQADS